MKYYQNKQEWAYALVACILLIIGGCSNNDDIGPNGITGQLHALRFTDSFKKDMPEVISVNSDAQTIELHLKGVENFDITKPIKLACGSSICSGVSVWDEEKNDWVDADSDSQSQVDSFYHIEEVERNEETFITASFNDNNTDKERKILLHIASYDPEISRQFILVGYVEIIQLPASSEADTTLESFSLRARYKGKVYSTEASIDDDGDYVYENPEYKALMDRIDADPSAQMLIMDDETICYYDNEDIADNRPYEDICALSPTPATRATGFEAITSTDMAFVGLFDNDHFGGSNVTHGLPQYDYTWNIPTMNWYSLNDKITSIALGYNGKDALVCSVLTIWDDSNYNHGDNNRSKHRISIVASKNSPRVSVADLKKVKKIGSSKSWNDCISSISLHFGYTDRLLRDY
jgi:hypothetical protein